MCTARQAILLQTMSRRLIKMTSHMETTSRIRLKGHRYQPNLADKESWQTAKACSSAIKSWESLANKTASTHANSARARTSPGWILSIKHWVQLNGTAPEQEWSWLFHLQTACHKQAAWVRQRICLLQIPHSDICISKRVQLQNHSSTNKLEGERNKSITYRMLYKAM